MQNARKTVKLLHSVAAAGLIGGLAAYMALLVAAPQGNPEAYAGLRQSIQALSDYVLLPSLMLGLVSGLLSMVVHTPFLDRGWVWVKAILGILMFKGVLTIVHAKADYAAGKAAEIAAGTAPPDALDQLLSLEWGTLWAVMAISIANVVLGVWRPKMIRSAPRPVAKAAPRKPEPMPQAEVTPPPRLQAAE
ncbi:MAG: DUF2269 family protein [Pseudomonadota bacterium]